MGKLISIDKIESFKKVKEINEADIIPKVIEKVKQLNEKTELEPLIRKCIFDFNDTPHGPAEIADILTVKTRIGHEDMYTAMILKGKSFKTIKAQDVSHQIYRLKKINNLDFAVFAYTGNVLDQVIEQFIATCNELACYYSIWSSIEISRLFIAFGLICPRDGLLINDGKCTCGYTFLKEGPNLFQVQALRELEMIHKIGQNEGIIVLPTGTGKTRIAALDIKKHNFQSVLYIAHTHEILQDAETEFLQLFPSEAILRVQLKSELPNLKRINFITIQLVSKNLEHISQDAFDYIIVDEFHHSAATSYLKLIDYFEYNFLLGLTATPFRMDRKDILELCGGNYIISVELRQAIEAGILSPYHYYGCFDDIDYSKIEYNGINYDVKDLERALIIPKREEAIFNKWVELANDKPTIAFCCTQKHAERTCKYFKRKGISSEIYVAKTRNRDEIRRQFNEGEIKILFTVDVLNEGVNFPFVECLLFLRPTESKRIFMQQLGRGLRKYFGKNHTIVLDFIGNFANAYRVVEYLGLNEYEDSENPIFYSKHRSSKEIFNLPLGCEIYFDERVIDIFSNQVSTNYKYITRFNIARILTQQYVKLCARLNRRAKWVEIDRYCTLSSEIYKIMFVDMKQLQKAVAEDLKLLGI